MRFTIEGKFKPYVRMTRRSKWVNKQAIEYNHSQVDLKMQLREQLQAAGWSPIPPRTPFGVTIEIMMPARVHCQDMDNQEKALIDAAQGVIFPNDLWMDAKTTVRVPGDRHLATMEFRIIK